MELAAIGQAIDEALSAFTERGIEVTGYEGDSSSLCGWMFQFSTCWRFAGNVATVRVRCMPASVSSDRASGLKLITTADIAAPHELPTICDRWSHVVPFDDLHVIGVRNLIEAELADGAQALAAAVGRPFAAEDRAAPH